jgi:hypothetical protein
MMIKIDSTSLAVKHAIFHSFYYNIIKSTGGQIIHKNSDRPFWFCLRIITEECQNRWLAISLEMQSKNASKLLIKNYASRKTLSIRLLAID